MQLFTLDVEGKSNVNQNQRNLEKRNKRYFNPSARSLLKYQFNFNMKKLNLWRPTAYLCYKLKNYCLILTKILEIPDCETSNNYYCFVIDGIHLSRGRGISLLLIREKFRI